MIRVLATLLITVVTVLCSWSGDRVAQVRWETGLDLPQPAAIVEQDSHGGFHGDGLLLVELSFAPEDRAAVEEAVASRGDLWNPGGFDGVLEEVLYAAGGPAVRGNWPRAGEGLYWHFRDRHRETDKPLTQRYSWNYTAALYDGKAGVLYYLEFDT